MNNIDICPHFGICGGCSRQDIPYLEQLQIKEELVKNSLSDLPVENIHSIWPSPEEYFYRNKMEYSFGDQSDIRILNTPRRKRGDPYPTGSVAIMNPQENEVHLGLHPKGRFALVTPTPDCRLQSTNSQKILKIVSDWATSQKISVFLRKNHSGTLRHLLIREGKNTGEIMVNLIAKSDLDSVDELAHQLKESGIPITTFFWTSHDGLSDSVQGHVEKIYWGNGCIRERVGKWMFNVTASSFMQTNTHASEKMLSLLNLWADETSQEGFPPKILFDFYCGSGAIGLNLSEKFEKVVGVELNKTAVEDGQQNARINNISNVEFHCQRVEEYVLNLSDKSHLECGTVVVDPPRPGIHSQVSQVILEAGPQNIFYVSCNPVSLSRDLRLWVSKYRISDVQPMDFFPHTDHVETAVRLIKKK